ncbi:MAG TPA: DUF6491 family protein [Rhodanobacteraceae bacterium]|nr:DUF6491 family protein [Rhodanobacteraceae bacterium]
MRIGVIVAFAVALAACASTRSHDDTTAAAAPDKPRATTNDYRRYIRGNVPAFNSARIIDWDSPDPNHVVVWTSPAEAYLLTLIGACLGLESTKTILLSADGGVVRPGGAAVMVGPDRCPIQLVDRLDAKAMKADGLH